MVVLVSLLPGVLLWFDFISVSLGLLWLMSQVFPARLFRVGSAALGVTELFWCLVTILHSAVENCPGCVQQELGRSRWPQSRVPYDSSFLRAHYPLSFEHSFEECWSSYFLGRHQQNFSVCFQSQFHLQLSFSAHVLI